MNRIKAEADFIRSLSILANNASADGESTNRIQYSNYTTSLEPVSNETVLFQITEGNAKFTNGSTVYRTTTDSSGIVTATLTDTKAETVTVKVTTTSVTSSPLEAQVTFIKGGDTLVISSVTTEEGRVFATGEPTIAWSGAVLKVTATGGSGSYEWTISGTGLTKDEELTNGILCRFTTSATTSTRYTISVVDKANNLTDSYSFTLADFYETFGSSSLYALTDHKKLPSPTQLLNLYSEWGPMSNYSGWTDKTDVYWTNEVGLLATVINVDNGQTSKSEILVSSHGYAKLKK